MLDLCLGQMHTEIRCLSEGGRCVGLLQEGDDVGVHLTDNKVIHVEQF